MGWFSNLFGSRTVEQNESRPQKRLDVVVGATKEADEQKIQSFTNGNITFNGELSDFDYTSILRDKQTNIQRLYQLSDYYTDADPIVRGIIKHVYVPFCTCSPWFLTGKEKTVNIYLEHYKKMRLQEIIDGVFLEYWKYGNVCLYLLHGQIITLPVNQWRIGNTTLNGMPIVDFDCQTIYNSWRTKNYSIRENWIKDNDLENYFKGYPEEMQEALNAGQQYCQLNPENTFVMQGSKESWHRYAIPFIASCLNSLARKELITKYENATLNLATRGFVHVRYGDDKKGADMLPDRNQLTQIRRIFSTAMNGFPLAVTNQLAKADFVQADINDLFQWDKYKEVNNDILSAGGISGVLVSGVSEDGLTFASAQVSMQTAEARINAARDEFCDIMTRINARLTEEIQGTYNLKEIPEFRFMPLDMSGKKALREQCLNLWQQGVVSTKTMMEAHGYSIDTESKQREKEKSDGYDDTLSPRGTTASSENKAGRPTLDDSERTSDPEKSETGKEPKPSNPEGSMSE